MRTMAHKPIFGVALAWLKRGSEFRSMMMMVVVVAEHLYLMLNYDSNGASCGHNDIVNCSSNTNICNASFSNSNYK